MVESSKALHSEKMVSRFTYLTISQIEKKCLIEQKYDTPGKTHKINKVRVLDPQWYSITRNYKDLHFSPFEIIYMLENYEKTVINHF